MTDRMPIYVSISLRTMEERIHVACQNISIGSNFDHYMDHFGGSKCSMDTKYLVRYSVGVKLNAWLIEMYQREP